MKQSFLLYTLVSSIFQLKLYQHGVQSRILNLEIKEDYFSNLASSSKEGVEPSHSPEIESSELKSNEVSQKIEVTNQAQESDLDEFHNFWNQDNDYMSLKDSSSTMIQNLNKLLTSAKVEWAEKVFDLFQESKVEQNRRIHDIPERLKLLHILNKLIRSCQVPLKAVQVVWFQLRKFDSSGGDPSSRNLPFSWPVIFKTTLGAYEDKMISQIRSIEPEKDFVDFENMKSEFEHQGVQLSGDWLKEDQKKLFILWTSKINLYYRIKDKPILQKMIETQVIQTSLIKDVQTLSNSSGSDHGVFKEMAASSLKAHSRVLMDYVNSSEYSETSHLFISLVNHTKPYGLEFDPRSNPEDETKILSFWVTYIDVFLKMKNLGETRALQLVINKLVQEDFEETRLIMENFMFNEAGKEFALDKPVLCEFLRRFSKITKTQSRQWLALQALSDFQNSSSSNKV